MVHVLPAGVVQRDPLGARPGGGQRPQPDLPLDAQERAAAGSGARRSTVTVTGPPPATANLARRPERSLALVGQVHPVERRRQLHLRPGSRDGERHLAVVLEREAPAPGAEIEALASRSPERRRESPGSRRRGRR